MAGDVGHRQDADALLRVMGFSRPTCKAYRADAFMSKSVLNAYMCLLCCYHADYADYADDAYYDVIMIILPTIMHMSRAA